MRSFNDEFNARLNNLILWDDVTNDESTLPFTLYHGSRGTMFIPNKWLDLVLSLRQSTYNA